VDSLIPICFFFSIIIIYNNRNLANILIGGLPACPLVEFKFCRMKMDSSAMPFSKNSYKQTSWFIIGTGHR